MGASCSECHSGDAHCALPPAFSCDSFLEGGPGHRTRLRVGSYCGLLDAPIHFALSHRDCQSLAFNLHWVQCPPEAGAVMSMLCADLIDMAVMYTEDAVLFAAEGNPLRFCGTFVHSPRQWGIFTSSSGVQDGMEMHGGTIGMPEERGASLTVSLLGEQPGWASVLYSPRRPFGSIHRAADAMSKSLTRVTIWERHSARHFVAAGEWRPCFKLTMPWPAEVLVASREALYGKSQAMRHFMHFAQLACEEFKADKGGEASKFISLRSGLTMREASEFINSTCWDCKVGVDVDALSLPLEHLKKTGLIDWGRSYDLSKYLATEFNLVNQREVLSEPEPCKWSDRPFEGEEFGRLTDPTAASSVEDYPSPREVEPVTSLVSETSSSLRSSPEATKPRTPSAEAVG